MARDRLYFDRRLDERNENLARAAELDRTLWDELGQECAVLVSDMSGFTRITRKKGILHFLALHRTGVRIAALPIQKFVGSVVKDEADNMICVFPDTESAVRAAAEIQIALKAHNRSEEDPDSLVELCIGISRGKILRLQDDAFGDAVNVAYKLGEDIAGPGDILLSKSGRDSLADDFDAHPIGEQETARIGDVDIFFYRVTA